MPVRGSTSFLKRQKEQQRAARANAKRAARQARRDNRQAESATEAPEDLTTPESVDPAPEPDAPGPGGHSATGQS